MNKDEAVALVTKLAIASFGSWLGNNGFDVTQLPGAVSAVGTLASLGFGIYIHRGMKKVPETAIVVPFK